MKQDHSSETLRRALVALLTCTGAAAQDLQVELWTNPSWPNGIEIGRSGGLSFGDLDADGWVDIFGARSGELWHNLNGQDWEVWRDVVPFAGRYGCALGDYNLDGLLDIATETRGHLPEPIKLLKNLGQLPNFVDVMVPGIVDLVPWGNCETNLWADVDFDGDQDLFVPVYPPWIVITGCPGNFFLKNMGPTGAGGEYTFLELSAQVGLDNPPGTSRPEGAEFCDVDADGDLDLYSNGTLYQNNSSHGSPLFTALDTPASGIPARDITDEGVFFFDYDMDGDFDVLISWCDTPMIRVVESYGDGTFFLTPKSTIDQSGAIFCLAVSHADWDNDGDIDFQTQDLFRRNMFVETGKRHFVVATHGIDPAHMGNRTVSWADWDKDGDMDLGLGAFGADTGFLYDNTIYDADTAEADRRYVRVRVVTDSDVTEFGTESEYGASVSLVIEGDGSGRARRQLVTSAGGYVNQNEYTLHFGLPEDPSPGSPEDLYFSLSVDLPSDPQVGLKRIDRRVNPRLARIHLAELQDREITIYRSGMVVMNGCEFAPVAGTDGVLTTTTGGLASSTDAAPLQPPSAPPGADWFVGLAFDTLSSSSPVRVQEVVIDGQIAKGAQNCGSGKAEIIFWDVTDPSTPVRVTNGTYNVDRAVRNHRHYYPVDVLLRANRSYRVVAFVDELRASGVSAPVQNGPVTVHGGLSYSDPSPCDGLAASGASIDNQNVYLALRLAEYSGPLWADLGYGLAGSGTPAQLSGTGLIRPGATLDLRLDGGPASQPTSLVVGATAACKPMAGGLLLPSPDQRVPLMTDSNGSWQVSWGVPVATLPGSSFYFQVWYDDPGGPVGKGASNALSATTPY